MNSVDVSINLLAFSGLVNTSYSIKMFIAHLRVGQLLLSLYSILQVQRWEVAFRYAERRQREDTA